jgi:predicted PurR-regulated permease PerM
MADEAGSDPDAAGAAAQREPEILAWLPRLGLLCWSFVGFVVALAIVTTALAAVNEIVLPLTFAAVLAVVFRPVAEHLERRGLRPTIGAGLVVLGLIAGVTVVAVATVRGIVDQVAEIGASVDAAMQTAADELAVDVETLEAARSSVEAAAPVVGTGFLSQLVDGVSTLLGLASGLILGALIMYYLLKDGARLQRAFVDQLDPSLRPGADDFLVSTGRSLRDYGRGRTLMSASVAVVIGLVSLLLGLPLIFTIVVANFIGGYIPYIGAFLGGGLAVMVALGESGLPAAAVMLVVVVAANLILENVVEPKVMGDTLHIHPLVVLVVTALGGLVGGIVGLILAVPFYVIAKDAFSRLRSGGFFADIATRAEPTVRRALS